MSTTNPWSFHINGVLSTDKTVTQNLETLCNATGAWLTFDYSVGKWSFVLNKAGTSISSFDDSNIVGPITVNGTGITELYNSVRVEFPHIDLNDEPDYVVITLPNEDRFPNEDDNQLQIQYDILNDPIQAQRLGFIELKQSRVDKVIQFQTDYSKLGLKAGDLIDVTSSVYGWTNKVFRIVTIEEVDSDGGSIDLAITAMEYDANVYSTDDLYRYARYNSNGIMSIGAIGQPGIPIVTKYEYDSRPRIEIETTVNNGIVNGMEFWYYSIPPSELPNWQAVDDSTRVYTLYDTVRPSSDADSVYATGETVTLALEGFDPGNFLVKVRAVNDTTSSIFSDISGLVEYVPIQSPDAINQETQVADPMGNLLPALVMSKIAGWALSKAPGWDTPGGVVDQLGMTVGDFTQPSGAPANAGFALSSQIATEAYTEQEYNRFAGTATLDGFQGTGSSTALTFTFTVPYNGSCLQFVCESPYGYMDYQYVDHTGSEEIMSGVLMYFPTLVVIKKNGVQILDTTVDWQTQSTVINITQSQANGDLTGTWTVLYNLIPTYDLNMLNPYASGPQIYPYNLNALRATRVLLQNFA